MELFNLPNEMLHFILNKLALPDLVRSRSVCKKFKILIDNINKEKLIVFYESSGNCGKRAEFETNFDLRNSFKPIDDKFGFFKSSSFKQFFKNLKDLSIVSTYEKGYFQFDLLNEFPTLEKLLISPFLTHKNFVLDHPGLKYLSILRNSLRIFEYEHYFRLSENIKIIVKSKVEHLELHLSYNFIEIVYPENVLSLEVLNTNRIINFTDFLNLKSLRVSYESSKKGLNIKTIRKFESLDYFFVESYKTHYYGVSEIEIDKIEALSKKEIMNFLNELVKLKFNESVKIKKIYYFGIELVKLLEDYQCSDISLQLFNYRLLTDNLFYRKSINFNNLFGFLKKYGNLFNGLPANQLSPKLPADFFRKYNNIKEVTVKDLKDEKEFFNFLSQCNLNELSIHKSKLSQDFLNNLPSICGNTLLSLNLEGTTNKKGKNFDFEFLFRLNYIQRLVTISKLSFEFALKLFIDSRWLLKLEFKSNGKSIQLWYYPTKFMDDDFITINLTKFKEGLLFSIRPPCFKRNLNPEGDFEFNYDQLLDHLKKKGIKPFRSYTKLFDGKSCVIHGTKDGNMEYEIWR